jgi:hypothetical protein
VVNDQHVSWRQSWLKIDFICPLHPTNRNDSKSPVRILTITLPFPRIHVWSYHQKLDSLQSKIISLPRAVSDSMGPLGRRMLRRQKFLALSRYLVAY